MKLLFSSSSLVDVERLRSAIEHEGIQCEIRNLAVSASLAGAAFYPELWVLRDEDYGFASVVRDRLENPGGVPETEARSHPFSNDGRTFLIYIAFLTCFAGGVIGWRFIRAGVAIPGITAGSLFVALGIGLLWSMRSSRKRGH